MTVIQSNGRTASVDRKSYPFPSQLSEVTGPSAGYLPLLRADASATFEAMFRTQPMLYAAVMKHVYGIARIPLKVYEYGMDGESRDRVRAHPASKLIRSPFPYGSEFTLKAKIALDLNIHGEALVVKVRERGAGSAPMELWPIPWRKVQVIRDEHDNVLGFSVTMGSETHTLGREEVIHLELPGGSPMSSLRRTLALEDAAQTYQGENMRNGITQRAAFIADGRLPDNAIPRLREELAKFYSGSDNAGKAMILDNGIKPATLGVSAVDMDIINQRKLSREEVCVAYDLAPQLFGIEHAAYASISEYRRALHDAIATRLVLIEETFQSQLISPELAWDGIFVEFDTGEILRPDPETRARMHMLTQQAGVTSINERRRMENLPAIEDPAANSVLAPLNMAVVGNDKDEVSSLSIVERVNAVAALIRAGFSPADAARVIGLPEMEYLDVQPVTVRAVNETAGADPSNPDIPVDGVDGGTPAQGATDSEALVRSITNALITERPKSRRIERDLQGNITRIVEE